MENRSYAAEPVIFVRFLAPPTNLVSWSQISFVKESIQIGQFGFENVELSMFQKKKFQKKVPKIFWKFKSWKIS